MGDAAVHGSLTYCNQDRHAHRGSRVRVAYRRCGHPMNGADLSLALHTVLDELAHGAPNAGAFVLNPDDPGLLRSLDRLSAEAASVAATGGATIAAHVDHLRYGLALMNRWAGGEANPFHNANWEASWQITAVTEAEWVELRQRLRAELERWLGSVATPREMMPIERNGMIGSIVHLAYHLGAIRQIDRTLRGPAADDSRETA
jgi:hypothetical protein